jgi:cellobiose phosphorylase
MLHQPAYTRYQLQLGEITSYPPGYKENAGIFCHTNPWIMRAEARLGRSGNAFSYYQRINPSYREAISEVHKCEPYVYSQMIAGRDAPTHGEAKNSWLTGTASWNFVAISQWILGIRPDYHGLIIDPVIPEDWSGFKATREFRDQTYHIEVIRIGPGNGIQLAINGQAIEGTLIPVDLSDETSIQVECLIGSSGANTASAITQDFKRSETTL